MASALTKRLPFLPLTLNNRQSGSDNSQLSRPSACPLRCLAAHVPEKKSIDHAIGGHIMGALVCTKRSSRFRSDDAIDGTMIVASASKSALQCYDAGSIAISVSRSRIIVVSIVTIRTVHVRVR
jgi:hypothetical protein